MALSVIEEALEPIVSKLDELSLPDFLREAREAVGLKQYRAAEFIGIYTSRLKNLETGYFRLMPTVDELKGISTLYDVPLETLYEKAKEHVLGRKRKKIKDQEVSSFSHETSNQHIQPRV
jgi:transcriptional regulator with XRE-family HTH domain